MAAALDELAFWAGSGVAVFPVPYGTKAPNVLGWPKRSAEESWQLTARAIAIGPTNMAVRLGPTELGLYLGHFDLDGKCPCGGNLSDHEGGSGPCVTRACPEYQGVAPTEAMRDLLGQMAQALAVVETDRGYHGLFLSTAEIAHGSIPELGAEVAATAGRLSLLPTSLHPSGSHYRYLGGRPAAIPLVDIDALGYSVIRAAKKPKRVAGELPAPAPGRASEFQDLFALLRIIPGKCVRMAKGGDFYPCPWHTDTEASLQVDWVNALFYCFGCNAGGGLIDLAERLGCPDARMFPASAKRGLWGTNEPEAIHRNLVDLLLRLEPGKIRQSAEAADRCRLEYREVYCRVGRHPIGDAVPLSCHWPLCPRCGIGRFWRDLIAADAGLPERVQLSRLTLKERHGAADGRKIFGRMSAEMMRVRRNRLVAGSTARFVHFEPGGALVGVVLVALPSGTALPANVGEAWDVEDLGEVSTKEWHRHQVIEWLRGLDSIRTTEQLIAYHRATKSQQRFRHFGTWYGERDHAPRQKAGMTGEPEAAIEALRCDLHPSSPVKVRVVRGIDIDQRAWSSGTDNARAGRRHHSPGPAP